MIDYIRCYADRFGVEPICAVLAEHDIKIGPYPRVLDTGCVYAAVGSVAARRAS